MTDNHQKYFKYKKKYLIFKHLVENENGIIIINGGGEDDRLLTDKQLDDIYGDIYKFYELYQKHPSNIISVVNYIYAKFGPFKNKINAKEILSKKISDAEFYKMLRKNYTTDIDEINEFRKKTYRTKQISQKTEAINKTIHNNLPGFKCTKILDIGTEDINYILELEQVMKCSANGLNITSGYSHYVTYDEAVKSGKIILYDGINIPFKADEFSLTTIISVLHHVKNVGNFLKEVCRVTRNIYIRDNDMSNKTSKYIVDIQHELYEGVLYPGDRSPLYVTTNNQIVNLLKENDFRIIYNSVEKYFTRPYTILASKN